MQQACLGDASTVLDPSERTRHLLTKGGSYGPLSLPSHLSSPVLDLPPAIKVAAVSSEPQMEELGKERVT